MAEDVLKLHVGNTLQLERISPEFHDRYTVQLIGFLAGQSLVVTAPIVDEKVLFIKEGTRFAVRMLSGSHVKGFMTLVIHSATKPYPHLHLSYPEEVVSIAIRNADRIDTNILGLARNLDFPDSEEYGHPVLVKDLSLTGSRIESNEPLGKISDKLDLRFSMDVCGQDESISVIGEIRSREMKGARHNPEETRETTGLSFQSLDRMQEILINAYVKEQQSLKK
jgi:hypothetical protein